MIWGDVEEIRGDAGEDGVHRQHRLEDEVADG